MGKRDGLLFLCHQRDTGSRELSLKSSRGVRIGLADVGQVSIHRRDHLLDVAGLSGAVVAVDDGEVLRELGSPGVGIEKRSFTVRYAATPRAAAAYHARCYPDKPQICKARRLSDV